MPRASRRCSDAPEGQSSGIGVQLFRPHDRMSGVRVLMALCVELLTKNSGLGSRVFLIHDCVFSLVSEAANRQSHIHVGTCSHQQLKACYSEQLPGKGSHWPLGARMSISWPRSTSLSLVPWSARLSSGLKLVTNMMNRNQHSDRGSCRLQACVSVFPVHELLSRWARMQGAVTVS